MVFSDRFREASLNVSSIRPHRRAAPMLSRSRQLLFSFSVFFLPAPIFRRSLLWPSIFLSLSSAGSFVRSSGGFSRCFRPRHCSSAHPQNPALLARVGRDPPLSPCFFSNTRMRGCFHAIGPQSPGNKASPKNHSLHFPCSFWFADRSKIS